MSSSLETSGKETRELSLEEIIHISNKLGLEHAEKRREAELLELLRSSKRAQIMNQIESDNPNNKSFSEAKLKRLAEAHPDYLQLLEQIVESRSKAEKVKIRYDSYRNLFEAKRTMISLKKTEMRNL